MFFAEIDFTYTREETKIVSNCYLSLALNNKGRKICYAHKVRGDLSVGLTRALGEPVDRQGGLVAD